MSDTWIVLLGLPLAFVVGGMLGYRVGVIHGYDEAAGRWLRAAGQKQNSRVPFGRAARSPQPTAVPERNDP